MYRLMQASALVWCQYFDLGIVEVEELSAAFLKAGTTLKPGSSFIAMFRLPRDPQRLSIWQAWTAAGGAGDGEAAVVCEKRTLAGAGWLCQRLFYCYFTGPIEDIRRHFTPV